MRRTDSGYVRRSLGERHGSRDTEFAGPWEYRARPDHVGFRPGRKHSSVLLELIRARDTGTESGGKI